MLRKSHKISDPSNILMIAAVTLIAEREYTLPINANTVR